MKMLKNKMSFANSVIKSDDKNRESKNNGGKKNGFWPLFGLFFLGYAGVSGSIGGASADESVSAQPALQESLKKAYKRPDFIPFPEDNAYTPEKAALGKILFFDPRLSKSNATACSTCHNPSLGWEDGNPMAVGAEGLTLKRHSQTVLNLAWGETFFWDGRASSLEEQALGPIEDSNEMNQPIDTLIAELKQIAGYQATFENVFPDSGITGENIARALATYQRTIVSNKAPFDDWIDGEEKAIDDAARRGFALFNGKAGCAACHSGWNFTDDSFHDIGLSDSDIGRAGVISGIEQFNHAFKTPGLRNLTSRAPYMHDGSLNTLEEVIDHYNDGFVERPSLSFEMKKLALTPDEKADLVAFLRTLESQDDPVTFPILPN